MTEWSTERATGGWRLCFFVYPSDCLFVYLLAFLPIDLSNHLPICLSMFLFICLFIYLFIHLSIYRWGGAMLTFKTFEAWTSFAKHLKTMAALLFFPYSGLHNDVYLSLYISLPLYMAESSAKQVAGCSIAGCPVQFRLVYHRSWLTRKNSLQ